MTLNLAEENIDAVNYSEVELAAFLFHQGTNFTAYDYLGVHSEKTDSGYKYYFRVWAPNAERIELVSDFTSWECGTPLSRSADKEVWELIIETSESLDGRFYKFAVTGRDGKTHLKADPYAFQDQTLSDTASIIRDITSYKWSDAEWFKKRSATVCPKARGFKPKVQHYYSAPLNIYEVHLASWRTLDGKSNADGCHYLNYREIADRLSVYVKEMGYTHVELLPVTEYPFDGSWGYQVCGYYAPTSRFGDPDDFRYFVEKMHSLDIGVILDWVPAHFPKDEHGLYEFDGQPLYEYQGRDRMENAGWGTRYFDVGRPEIQSFLVSNALFWMRQYHVDGLRIDAVAAMLYLDYDKKPGEWVPNKYGDNKNLESIAFFQKLNTAVFAEFPDALMIAEESTSWPMITGPVSEGGLGFNFKWNMGWANDVFDYIQTDSLYREKVHNKLTFPMMYAFSENYILPISHDEVVHGKRSLVDKCFGEYDDKFGCMRTLIMYMMTFPGKKLMFMGTEFAQFREWDYANQLEWFMIDYPRHVEMQRFVKRMNHVYLENPELWEIDDSWDGFEWIYADNASDNIYAYRRISKRGEELIVVLNFAPVEHKGYPVPVQRLGRYEEILSTDNYEYGGKNKLNEVPVRTHLVADADGTKHNEINIDIPPLGGVIFKKMQNK